MVATQRLSWRQRLVEVVSAIAAMVTRWIVQTVRGDGVTGLKRHRPDLSSDGIRKLMTASERSQPKETLEDLAS
ncbi:hypothetical protein Tco_0989486 [Tanacetum coccineum]|uniref:Uncharacterized protein n=1 Tax=Tanacetum coccineum TaxID=301880 RepID=A0ABQ5EVA1_9ASTR